MVEIGTEMTIYVNSPPLETYEPCSRSSGGTRDATQHLGHKLV
jgi:hypothetical protein